MANGSIKKIIEKNNVKYRCLDYIQSTGTQYINTNIQIATATLSNDLSVEVECAFTNTTISTNQATGKNQNNFFFFGANTSRLFYSGIGNSYTNTSKSFDNNFHKHKLEVLNNKGKYYIDGSVATDYGTLSYATPEYVGYFHLGNTWTPTGGTVYTSNLKIKHCVCYYKNELFKDLIPVERVTDNVLGMLDLVSGNFLTNAGSGTFTKGNYIQVEHIYKPPFTENGDAYYELKYIESTGTQYINLNKTFGSDFSYIKYITQGVAKNGSINGIFGFHPAWQYNQKYLGFDDKYKGVYGGLMGNADNPYVFDTTYTSKATFEASFYPDEDMMKLNNESPTDIGKYVSGFGGGNCYICGAVNEDNTPKYFSKSRHFYVLGKKGNDIVFELIPVERASDNVIGMFDKVSKTFLTNDGTGTFVSGGRIEVEKITHTIISNNVKYYPLDYLEATGTQFIETLSNFTNTKRLKIKWLSNSDIVQYGHDIMGKNTSSDTYNFIVQERYDSSKLVLINNKPNTRIDTTQTTLKEHVLEVDWRTLPYKYILDGVETTRNSAVQDFGNYNLFKASDNSRLAKAKIYYYECYDSDNELSFNLIPAENESGVKGMLDLISDTFYPNSGTGTFTGPKREIILVE